MDILVQMRTRRQLNAVATVVEITGFTFAKRGCKAVIDSQDRVVAG